MGELRVSDPITKYVARVPADKQGITLHHLLTHSSGLVASLGGDYEPLTRDGMLATALETQLQSQPGTTYRYSNVGYSVLAAIVEDVSGMGYEQFLARHLFEPAGMTQTGYVLPDWENDRVESSTTQVATRTADRTNIRGPTTARTGTCAGTAACSPPR